MNTRGRFGLLVAFATALGLAACDDGAVKASVIERVVSTTSFGMCMGYCKTRLEITQGEAVLVREPGGRGGTTLPVQRFTATAFLSFGFQPMTKSRPPWQFARLPPTSRR